MDVSVAICTWNRADLLDQTLTEMRKLRIPEGISWELLVVNNNCADHTDKVIARHAKTLPVRELFEAKPGHSHARNCAVQAVEGDLLIWTDDDVLVDPEWLAEYVAAVQQFSDAAYFGGRVDPWFEVKPDAWLQENLQRVQVAYAIRSFGPEVRPFEPGERPVGANMAFRMSILSQYSFRTDLGHQGNSMVGGDEIELFARMQADGYVGVCVGSACVRHFIPKERANAEFLWQFNYGGGRTHVRMHGVPKCPYLWGAPRWAVREYCRCRLVSWLLAPFKSRSWIDAFIHAAQLRGLIDECRELGRASTEAVGTDVSATLRNSAKIAQ